MKRQIIQSVFILLMPYLAMASDHLLINEVVLQPSAGEYILITNPTAAAINLSDYYLTDGTDKVNGKYYYNLPSGTDYWSSSSTDFIARFPDTTISAGGSLILSMARNSDYETTYGSSPNLSLKDHMLDAVDGTSTIGGSPNVKLDNTAESLILFHWDGTSTTVEDVEYLIWGTDSTTASAYTLDKSLVAGYAADTPVEHQSFMTTHLDGSKLIRNGEEGTETTSSGNGITGHDETSENLAETWSVVDLTIVKPAISNISATPSDPETTEDVVISADVTDDAGISSVTLTYTFPADTGTPVDLAMASSGNDSYSATIPATNAEGTLAYYITAENTSGLSETSSIGGVAIADPPPPVTIQTIRENFNSYSGTIVNLNVVVAIGSGITRTDRTEAYVQDESGYGIVLSATGLMNPALVQGDSINLVGEVSEYNGTKQIINFSSTQLATGRPVPGIRTITSAELASDSNQGSFVRVWGAVQSRSDGVGGGSNIGLEDADGLLTIRIWDTTHLLDDLTADSLLQVGNLVQVDGVASEYNGDGQLLAAYASDIQAYKEGEDSDGGTSLSVAPYPFVPQLAEKIQYTYKFPSNSRVTLRIFDMSGHIVTTLFEDYRSLSLEVTKTWNGRNEIYQVVAPGTYVMHLETVNRSTGEILTDMAPVVIGSK
ncbi:MAG: hypothetical protein HOD43_14680 [Candidatus Marinimicrobia bacterium]|jgi:DNA/RNA endonuclease YhcR with UshA esterase domain|nr:hypothetical protein [Candidatus Neomarinimicrobiota bacterium]MBT3825475.1 hypothetical protein [Candidatus Neomarinimicrobiota bacterium]MBT4131236.1 hypothetical protein [Candidatus Neomarinimicrobiota bacterium]MBT4297042.1 hypothetical protein [Candidatus Neomarinimicrobiota bacterium]MBT4420271.1 hypothetical protein [Candidatus Neomarinimicrobiota bacterium]